MKTLLAAVSLSALTACGTINQTATTTPASETPSQSPHPMTMADAERCHSTKPSQGPPALQGVFFGWASSYGNGQLWVGGLSPDGVIEADKRFIEKDGSISMKFGWWREVHGRLTITGRRLDADAPPLRGALPDGYGQSGFQASGVYFRTEGCWEVSGRVGTTTLTFVNFVIKKAS